MPASLVPPSRPYAFRRTYRLCKTDEYSSVFAFRRALRGRFFMLHYRPGEGSARLGVVMAKKLARKAVTRNLLKRLARDIFRRARPGLPACDMVLRLSASPKGASRRDLRDDLQHLIGRLPR